MWAGNQARELSSSGKDRRERLCSCEKLLPAFGAFLTFPVPDSGNRFTRSHIAQITGGRLPPTFRTLELAN